MPKMPIASSSTSPTRECEASTPVDPVTQMTRAAFAESDGTNLHGTYQRILHQRVLHSTSVQREALSNAIPELLNSQPFTSSVQLEHRLEALELNELDEPIRHGFRSLKAVASATRSHLLKGVLEGCQNSFDELKFVNQLAAGRAINWQMLGLEANSQYQSVILNLYHYAISHPSKFISLINHPSKHGGLTGFDKLPNALTTLCLTQPAFELTKRDESPYHRDREYFDSGYGLVGVEASNLIGVALCYQNLDLANALKIQLKNLLPERDFVFGRKDITLLWTLGAKGYINSAKWFWDNLDVSARHGAIQVLLPTKDEYH